MTKKNVQTFEKDRPYPIFNPDNNVIPGIPNWKRKFGDYEVSFSPGIKKYNKSQDCGDYIIYVSPSINKSPNFTDKDLWKILEDSLKNKKIDKDKFLKTLYLILNCTIEEKVYNYINKSCFEEKIKIVLYVLWHRAIIEDRIYPPPEYNGRKRIIGLTYGLIKGKYKNIEDIYKEGQSRKKKEKEFENLYQQFNQEMMKSIRKIVSF